MRNINKIHTYIRDKVNIDDYRLPSSLQPEQHRPAYKYMRVLFQHALCIRYHHTQDIQFL
jgi:hypothetical protein